MSISIFSTVMILNSKWGALTIQTNLIFFIYNLRIEGQKWNMFSPFLQVNMQTARFL